MNSGEQLDLGEGIRRREQGMEAAAGSQGVEWMEQGRIEVAALAARHAEFTVDQLPPKFRLAAKHHNAIGALMASCLREGIVECIGYRKSRRVNAHARVVPVYAYPCGSATRENYQENDQENDDERER